MSFKVHNTTVVINKPKVLFKRHFKYKVDEIYTVSNSDIYYRIPYNNYAGGVKWNWITVVLTVILFTVSVKVTTPDYAHTTGL